MISGSQFTLRCYLHQHAYIIVDSDEFIGYVGGMMLCKQYNYRYVCIIIFLLRRRLVSRRLVGDKILG